MTPKVRFRAEDGTPFPDWEEHTLGALLKYEQPKAYIIKNDNYAGQTKYPVLTAKQQTINDIGYQMFRLY